MVLVGEEGPGVGENWEELADFVRWGGRGDLPAAVTVADERSHQKSPEFYALSPFEMEENTCFAERLSVCLLWLTLLSKSLFVTSQARHGGLTLKVCAQRGESVCLAASLRTAALPVPESLHPTPCNWGTVGQVPGGRDGQPAT